MLTALTAGTVLALTRPLSSAPATDRAATLTPGTRAEALPFVRRPPASPPAAPHPLVTTGPTRVTSAQRTADPVGTLFTRHGHRLGRHFCTASVVSSRSGDLLITAAHCMLGVRLNPVGRIVFAPGYQDGRFPHSLWAVTRKYVDVRWARHRDQDDDVAFLAVTRLAEAVRGARGPADPSEPPDSVERAAGAERVRFGSRLPLAIRAIGYPDGHGRRIACWAHALAFHPGSLHQVRFICPGFTDGTSGGPMLRDFSIKHGSGAIIGVIGGYQRGGDSPSISYSSAFAGSIRALYRRVSEASR